MPGDTRPQLEGDGLAVAGDPTVLQGGHLSRQIADGIGLRIEEEQPAQHGREPLTTLPVSAVISVLSVGIGCHIPIVIVFSPPWAAVTDARLAR